MARLSIYDLHKNVGVLGALKGVNLEIKSGELFALLGSGSSSQSLLLRCIAGFERPDSGSIELDGVDVSNAKPSERKVAVLFQKDTLWPHFSILESVEAGLQQLDLNSSEVRLRAGTALKATGISHLQDKKPSELSSVEQQRASLARAIVTEPSCLLLDRPFAHLSTSDGCDLRMLLLKLAQELNLAILLIPHHYQEGLSVADRIGILIKGKMLQVGKPAEVYKRPVTSEVASFLGDTNFLPGKLLHTGAGEGLVATELGEFRGQLVAAGHQCLSGAQVVLAIRPECWKIDIFPADENNVTGTLRRVTFWGAYANYELMVQHVCLNVMQANPSYLQPDSDQLLHAWVAPEDVIILPAATQTET